MRAAERLRRSVQISMKVENFTAYKILGFGLQSLEGGG